MIMRNHARSLVFIAVALALVLVALASGQPGWSRTANGYKYVHPGGGYTDAPVAITGPTTIAVAGNYVLANNITIAGAGSHGINIQASNVTVDFAGYYMDGASIGGGHSAVLVSGGTRTNITIKNGAVRHWTGYGIDLRTARNSIIQNMIVSECGSDGIYLLSGRIENCVSRNNSGDGVGVDTDSSVSGVTSQANDGDGIQTGAGCSLANCAAGGNGGIAANAGFNVGIGSTLVGCSSQGNSGSGFQGNIGAAHGITFSSCSATENAGHGFDLASFGQATMCTASVNGADGFFADTGICIQQCVSSFNGQWGINTQNSCLIRENLVHQNGESDIGFGGIKVGHYCVAEENSVLNNIGIGILADTGILSSTVQRNRATNNTTTNYSDLGTSSDWGPLGVASTATSPWTNIDNP